MCAWMVERWNFAALRYTTAGPVCGTLWCCLSSLSVIVSHSFVGAFGCVTDCDTLKQSEVTDGFETVTDIVVDSLTGIGCAVDTDNSDLWVAPATVTVVANAIGDGVEQSVTATSYDTTTLSSPDGEGSWLEVSESDGELCPTEMELLSISLKTSFREGSMKASCRLSCFSSSSSCSVS